MPTPPTTAPPEGSHRSDAPKLPELPELDPGITLLEADERTREALHALVVDAVCRDGAEASWIDARGHATTRPLAALAPGPRVRDRIHVARGFTPFQHYEIVGTAVERTAASEGAASEDAATGGCAAPVDPGVVVAPALDGCYRQDEVRRAEGREMLARAVAALAGLARRCDVPVLVTRTADDRFAAPVERAAASTVECTWTRLGPRFDADGFETLVYPASRGHLQTTLAFWERVLAARHAARGVGIGASDSGGASPSTPDPAVHRREVTAGGAH